MNAFAFRHLPELCGKIVPAEVSRLRATDDVFASWDAQALALGLGVHWRCCDEWLEASRRALLDCLDGQQDLWIFAYGSLMWDPALHFTELRRARLPAYQRRFSYLTTIGRGNAEQAGLVLSLEALFRESQALIEEGVPVFERLRLSPHCPLIQRDIVLLQAVENARREERLIHHHHPGDTVIDGLLVGVRDDRFHPPSIALMF